MLNMKVFGKRLRLLREEKNLTQIELAKKLSVANSTISQYEAGNRMPDAYMLEKIATYFGTTIDYLLGRTDIRQLEHIPFDYSQLFQQEDEGQAYILAAELRYKYKLSDETFLKIIDEIGRYYNREKKPLDGEIAAHGPDIPGTGGFNKEELESPNKDNKGGD